MNGQQAVDRLKFLLNRGTSASTTFEAQFLTELNNAQDLLERGDELPHFLLSERARIAIDVGEERVVLPTNFLREYEESDMQVEDTEASSTEEQYTELRKTNLDHLRRRFPDEMQGRPQGYTLQGNYFRLRPVPDKGSYRLWMSYYKSDSDIVLGGTNGWLTYYPDLVIGTAGMVLAAVLKNQSAMANMQVILTRARDLFLRNETARKEENFDPNPED